MIARFLKPYAAYVSINLKLTWRDRMVVVFNYLFPLIFFFTFAELNKAEQGGAINTVFSSVLVIGMLGNGFFGGGIRAVVEREQNILRRFKVAPITPAPILVSAVVGGLLNYLPSVLLMFAISHFRYGMPVPRRWLSAVIFVIIGTIAFRALGQIVAAVANSMAESQIIIQTLYFPMMFLSGATFPITMFPSWLQIVTQFIPATHLYTGMQEILVRGAPLGEIWQSALALVLTTAIGLFISMKLFRWEKDEKLKPSAKLWILAVLVPFFLIGGYQAYSRDSISSAKQVTRALRRSRSLLIENVRVFVGDGKSLESAAVLIRNGKIEEVYTGAHPDGRTLRAEPVDGQGKTLLPALIDAQVTLSAPGGIYERQEDYAKPGNVRRALAAYLFSGAGVVLSSGEAIDIVARESRQVESGELLAAEAFMTGPLFTTKGGAGTEGLRFIPAQSRDAVELQLTRAPRTVEEARRMVRDLKTQGASAIRAALSAGTAGKLVNRLDPGVLKAIGDEARAQGIPLMVWTGDSTDVSDAIAAGTAVIIGGSARDRIPDTVIAQMVAKKVAFMPLLAPLEGAAGNIELLDRSLVQQVGPADLLTSTKKKLAGMGTGIPDKAFGVPFDNLRRIYAAGVTVIAGSGGGSFLVFHGPAIQRELQLWVAAGLPTHAALQAATHDAAKLLGVANRAGAIRKGYDATLLMVNGNPLQHIEALEAISLVIFKGERIDRGGLFDEN